MTEACSICKTISGHGSRPRSPILSLEPPWKGAKAPHTPWSEAPGRQNYFKPKRHYLVLAASEASDQDVCGVYGYNFSSWFQWHHQWPCPTSKAGDIADFSPSTFSHPWQLPTPMASLFLSPAINLSPVSLSPVIIVHRCRCHPRYIYRRYQRHRRSLKIHDKD